MKYKLLKSCCVICTVILQTACTPGPIKGKWQYDGGIYNGKLRKATPSLIMQRDYTNDSYEAFVTEPGREPQKYGAGTYEIEGDTLRITSTYSSQASSQTLGKTIAYQFLINSDRLTIKGVLPNGMQVEEYWKKVK